MKIKAKCCICDKTMAEGFWFKGGPYCHDCFVWKFGKSAKLLSEK